MHAALCDYLMDLAHNAMEAAARHIEVALEEEAGLWRVWVKDDGVGMDAATRARALDPFFTNGIKHRERKVGLGLPFVKMAAEAAAGTFSLTSEKGVGTTVRFSMDSRHVDAPPLGGLADMVVALMSYPGTFELVFCRTKDGRRYQVTRRELIDAFGELASVESLVLAKMYLAGWEEEVCAPAAGGPADAR